VVGTARAVGVGQLVRTTGFYPRQRRRAALPRSANISKALRDIDDDNWALRVNDFPILINSEIDHSHGKNKQVRRKNQKKNSWR
jgi:hypothetical protein